MRTVEVTYLIRKGSFPYSQEWMCILQEIEHAIREIVWPPGNTSFVINPSKGKGRGEGNGVKPIKNACMLTLEKLGWNTAERSNFLRIDAVKPLSNDRIFALEWETGNISSSHRAINRLLLGHLKGVLNGGALVVPTRNLYQYLTDRVGNYAELEPYFALWRSYPLEEGLLAIIAIEHDDVDPNMPRIEKSTDGRALV